MKLLSNARMSSEMGVTEDSYRRADKGFIFTRSGKRVYFLGNKEKEIDVVDCCYSLARNYRWNGHTTIPWSVAQHSLLVAKMIEELKWRTPVKNKELAIIKGLTHDFTESYLGDLVTPVKREIELYNNIESELEKKIEETVDIDKDLTEDDRELVKRADTLSLIIEAMTIVNIDDKYRDYCNDELERSYEDVRGKVILEKYSKEIKVENLEYVSGKLLVELHKHCKEANRNLRCFEKISNKTLEEDNVVPVYTNGNLEYRIFNYGKSVMIKRVSDNRVFNMSRENFDNMITLEMIEAMSRC